MIYYGEKKEVYRIGKYRIGYHKNQQVCMKPDGPGCRQYGQAFSTFLMSCPLSSFFEPSCHSLGQKLRHSDVPALHNKMFSECNSTYLFLKRCNNTCLTKSRENSVRWHVCNAYPKD